MLALDTGTVTRLGLTGVSPHDAPSGHLVYATGDGVISAVPFDVDSLQVSGGPVPLLEGVMLRQSGAAGTVKLSGHCCPKQDRLSLVTR